LGEEKADIIRLKADLSLKPSPRCMLSSSGYRVDVLTLGCTSSPSTPAPTCVSLAVVSSLPTLPSRVEVDVCGNPISMSLSGTPIPKSEPFLIVHGSCELGLKGRKLRLPCEKGRDLPAYLEIAQEGEMQELGLNVRGKVLYKGELSIYFVSLPTGGELLSPHRTIRLNPGSYLLVTQGSGRLKVEGDELILP